MRAHRPPPPPGALNVVLSLLLLGSMVGVQWLASQASSGWARLGLGGVFAFLVMPLYSLLHEAEHRVFHARRGVNEAFGVVLTAFFPGPFTFMRACHLGHHRRNRSEVERFDLYYPHESRARRRAWFYFTYLGGFWLMVLAVMAVLLVWPRAVRSRLVREPSAVAMLRGIPESFWTRIRAESAGVVLLHAGLVWGLGLSVGSYLLLHALAGVCWSVQQYVPHAHSPRHTRDGAHNLRAHPLYEKLLLHFNWHLAHHQHPRVPWLYLPRYGDPTRERPGYLAACLRFWQGPQLAEPPSQPTPTQHMTERTTGSRA